MIAGLAWLKCEDNQRRADGLMLPLAIHEEVSGDVRNTVDPSNASLTPRRCAPPAERAIPDHGQKLIRTRQPA